MVAVKVLTPEERRAKIAAAVKRSDEERTRAFEMTIAAIKAKSKEAREARKACQSQPSQPQRSLFTRQVKPASPAPSSPQNQSSPPTGGGTRPSTSGELRKWSRLFLQVRWAQIKRADEEEKAAEEAAEKELEALRAEMLERKRAAMQEAIRKTTPAKLTTKNEEEINAFLKEWADGV